MELSQLDNPTRQAVYKRFKEMFSQDGKIDYIQLSNEFDLTNRNLRSLYYHYRIDSSKHSNHLVECYFTGEIRPFFKTFEMTPLGLLKLIEDMDLEIEEDILDDFFLQENTDQDGRELGTYLIKMTFSKTKVLKCFEDLMSFRNALEMILRLGPAEKPLPILNMSFLSSEDRFEELDRLGYVYNRCYTKELDLYCFNVIFIGNIAVRLRTNPIELFRVEDDRQSSKGTFGVIKALSH